MSKNKYNAQGVYWNCNERREPTHKELSHYLSLGKYQRTKVNDIVYFASRFELELYLELIGIFGFNYVIHQYSIPLFPEGRCYPRGRNWTIDFAIKKPREKSLLMLVESKGYPTEAFLSNLATLEAVDPLLFSKLTIVFRSDIPNFLILQNLRETNDHHRFGKVLTLSEFKEKYYTNRRKNNESA